MKKNTLRTMTALVSTVVLGSSIFTACSNKKNNLSTEIEDQNITVSPTIEATIEPTAVPTQEPTVEEVPEATKVPEGTDPAKLEITVNYESKDQELKDDENPDVLLVKGSSNRPVVTIPDNEEASKKINEYFAGLDDKFWDQMEEYKKNAKELHNEWVNNGRDDWFGYEIATSYNMERADEKCISFTCNSYFDLLGAHPSNELSGYTFNTSTGELITLNDLTDDLESLKTKVNASILEYCKQIEKEQGEGAFNAGYEDEIPMILQDNTWYLDDKGFEVIANEYTIAPHALGIINVLIPYGELVGVKDEYIMK